MRDPRSLSRMGALVAVLWGLFVPALAAACPVCAQRESGGVGRKIALGLMILLPFVVVGAVLFLLRAAERRFGALNTLDGAAVRASAAYAPTPSREEKLAVRSQA